jgi:Uma2 family endonuclease
MRSVARTSEPIQTWAKDDLPPFTEEDVLYPPSDGLPMADSTRQFDWITRIEHGLEAQFRDDENVFVAGDHFWYPVEGRPDIRTAPDTMVVFGRPQGHRFSYRQWREENIAPQVVFEIWSRSNRPGDKAFKLDFYERYGVEEYYAHDPRPRKRTMEGWIRRNGRLVQIANMDGWVSPRLGVKFRRVGKEWNLFHPNDEPFVDAVELFRQRDEALRRLETEHAANDAAWAKLRELGIDPESL